MRGRARLNSGRGVGRNPSGEKNCYRAIRNIKKVFHSVLCIKEGGYAGVKALASGASSTYWDLACVAPHDRVHRGGGLQRRRINRNPLPLQQPTIG